jgi:putative hydrolase of the HAD superfamily
MALRGILFDLDFTLVDNDRGWRQLWPAVAQQFAERYPGFDPEEFEQRSYDFADGHYELLLRGEIDFDTYRRDYVTHGVKPWGALDDDLLSAYNEARSRSVDLIELFDDAVETVRGLRAGGLKIGILTNGPSELQRRKLRLIGIEDEVDAVAVSEEIGAVKPDPEAYRRAVAMLGLEPGEVAMVGDHVVNDVAGALAAGLAAAVWVERRPDDGELPEGANLARELADVPSLLGLVDPREATVGRERSAAGGGLAPPGGSPPLASESAGEGGARGKQGFPRET